MRAIDPSSLSSAALEICNTWSRMIVATRKARGLSQEDLRLDAGIGRSTLIEIEAGSPRVQLAHWLSVLDRLDLIDALRSVPGAQVAEIAEAVKPPPRKRRHG